MGLTSKEDQRPEIERAHRTPPGKPREGKPSRPIHIAFLRYTDKISVLKNAASSLKNNPFKEKAIGISKDFGKTENEREKEGTRVAQETIADEASLRQKRKKSALCCGSKAQQRRSHKKHECV